MTTIYIDIETCYSKDYSLSKMSTEEYIRDEQFKVHGVSITVDDNTPVWLNTDAARLFLREYIEDFPDATWAAHNAQFDMAILSWRYGIRPAKIADTLSMARINHYHGKHSLKALAQEYGLGEKGDALIKTMGVRDLDPLLEQQLAEYCVQDVELLRRLYKRLEADLSEKLGDCRVPAQVGRGK